jgi:LCP family protein required for cell wall assembly
MLDELTVSESAVAGVKKKRRIRRIMMSLVSLMLLLAVGTGAAYVAFLNHVVTTNIKHAALLTTAGTNPDGTKAGTSTPLRQPTAKDAQNILVVGSDSRGSVPNGRSDVIVLVHISSDRKKVYLVHFPRDMYVNVPGHGKDKINAAFAYGGAPLLVQTLQGLVDVPIDHMAVIGFDGFQAMTDALGGLDVYAEEASTEPGSGTVHVGVNHLGGNAALAFVRERRLPGESDISRGRRQLAFIKALLLKSLTTDALANPIEFAGFMDVAAHNLTVDNTFSVAEMRSLTSGLRVLDGKNIVSITAPIKALVKDPKGAPVDLANAPRMAVLSIALKRDDMASFPLG